MAAPKRFWKQARAAQEDQGWGVRLDDRPLRTPGKAPLLAPTKALAEALAEEWDAQKEVVNPASMPLTRSVNTAIDRVADKHAEVVDAVAAYGASDLLCYRAPHPQALAERQALAWDPLLDWAERHHGARLVRAEVNIRREAGFTLAAKLAGNSDTRVLAFHIFPNALPPMMVQVSLNLGWAILNAAGLSFIGLGVRPPTPEWGIMVAEGANYIVSGEWWLALFPGLWLMLAVFTFNLMGDGLRDIVDPRRRT